MFAAQAFTGQLRMKLKSLAAATAALTLLLAGCSSGDSAAPPPAPQVPVATPLVQQVVDWDAYVGRLEADRQSVESGKSVSVSVELGGRRISKKKKKKCIDASEQHRNIQ